MRFTKAAAAAIITVLPATFAQTFTDCNPTEKTCPKDVGLDSANFASDFANNPKAGDSWSKAAYTTVSYDDQGAQFRIAQKGQAPTIQSNFYFFFGRVDVTMKPAPGQGIISSIVLESDDLDEIDWEFLGGVDNQVQTNFFGKGDTSSYDRMVQYSVDSAQEVYHTYSLDWTAERLQWIIDGTVVRELKYTDSVALNGKTYPQTPMRLKLGNWAGGAEGVPEGTVAWAGGRTDFSKGPFDMYVKDVSIQNYNPADSYEYGDKTGSWQSIKINNKDGSSSSSSSSSSGSTDTSSSSSTSASSAPSTTGANTTASAESEEQQSPSSTSTSNPYTSPASVQPLDKHTEAAVSITQTGSMYSTNTASASALNSAISATAGESTFKTSLGAVTTQVPGSQPTATSYGNGSLTHGSGNNNSTGGVSAAEQSTGAGVSLKGGAVVAWSVVGLAMGVVLL